MDWTELEIAEAALLADQALSDELRALEADMEPELMAAHYNAEERAILSGGCEALDLEDDPLEALVREQEAEILAAAEDGAAGE